MLPPGTGFIIAYILSPPELVESEERERKKHYEYINENICGTYVKVTNT